MTKSENRKTQKFSILKKVMEERMLRMFKERNRKDCLRKFMEGERKCSFLLKREEMKNFLKEKYFILKCEHRVAH